jgi:hypothetical protein
VWDGPSCPAPQEVSDFFIFLLFVLTSLTAIVTRTQEGFHPHRPSPQRPPTHAEHETTPLLVSFRFRHISYTLTQTPNTKPTSLVSFRGRRLSYALLHTPSTRSPHQGCVFVFGIFPTPTRRARNHTLVGVNSFRSFPTPSNEGCFLNIFKYIYG